DDGKVRVFEVRTSEKDSRKVLAYISQKLQGQLVMVHLERYGIEANRGAATGARLAFSNEAGEVNFVSRAQVQRLVANAFLARHKSPSAFSVEWPDRRALTWEKVRAAATDAFPVEGKPAPYADADNEEALTKAILERSARPRLDAWFTQKITPFDATK